MFVLVEMVDTVRTPPWQFERKLNDSIAEELNKKLANKVVYNVGLCICLFDITKLEDAYVFPGDGASHTKVHFRYVVFHPFLDEILIGKIKGCSPEGVHGEPGEPCALMGHAAGLGGTLAILGPCGRGGVRWRHRIFLLVSEQPPCSLVPSRGYTQLPCEFSLSHSSVSGVLR
ncbi:DNA-directed RNA polymerase III subunit RPC8 isoform X2 [Choloepus didactylus]|uniref:DNA-directed RNA polymerase III subunit RPC8 isoform X2 n=1 Tax=Choloepus didactylus TaxID=27675 RepID=UPI00189DE3C4|nr:DNA-directed RNA polymerase III subunit RPC8 isoform X2 [Choloepus didactylus]XP_037700947.1 DNA-directed RNA polymerase III subunit RPC8 isoform X2 [Choloepus didactylus]